jgi:uncharacterized membrane protein HdeD (DUF308 family)
VTEIDEADVEESFSAAARYWWAFLVLGIAWLLFAIVLLRFDYRTVSAISILFGIAVIFAGADEMFAAFTGQRSGWARTGHGLLAVVFLVIGVVAFVHPGNTFAALAAVMSFYFILKGAFDVGLALSLRHENDAWWLQLAIGIAEILIGFWAAGDFGRKTILLVIWVGVLALTRGISAIAFAFTVREFRQAGPVTAA